MTTATPTTMSTGKVQFTLIISECEHDGDVEHFLDELAAFGGGLAVQEVVSVGGIGHDQGVITVEISASDLAKFKAACADNGFVDGIEQGNTFHATVDRIEAEYEDDQDEYDQDEGDQD